MAQKFLTGGDGTPANSQSGQSSRDDINDNFTELYDGTTPLIVELGPLPQTLTAIGNGLSIPNATGLYLAALSSQRVVFTDSFAEEIRVFDWDGTDWLEPTTALSVPGMSVAACVKLTTTRFAFIDAGNTGNKELQTYDIIGTTITPVGTALSLPAISAKPKFAQMTERWIAFIDGGNDTLTTYDFDEITGLWTQVGNQASLPITTGFADACDLSPTRIIVGHADDDIIRAHDFDGVNWAKVGNDLTTLAVGANGMSALSTDRFLVLDNITSKIQIIDFDGENFQVEAQLTITGSTLPAVAGLDTNRFVGIGVANATLQTQQYSIPAETVIDDNGTQFRGTADDGYMMGGDMEARNHLLVDVSDDGLPSVMVRGKSVFGDDIDIWGGQVKRNSIPIAPNAENFVFVTKESDFGVAAGGEIPLTTNTHYLLMNPVTIFNQLVVPVGGLVTIQSTDQIVNILTHTQSGGVAWIKGTVIGVLDLMDLQVVQTTSTSQYFSIFGAPGSFLRLLNCRFTNDDAGGGQMGTISGFSNADISSTAFINNRSGLSVIDCDGQIAGCLFRNDTPLATIFLTFQTTSAHFFEVRDTKIPPRVGESAFDIIENPSQQDPASRYLIENCVTRDSAYDPGVVFTDLDQFDVRVNTRGNFMIQDSTIAANGILTGNTTPTDIPAGAQNGLIIMNTGNGMVYDQENRIAGNADGTADFTGLEPAEVSLAANVRMAPDTGGSSISMSTQYGKINKRSRPVAFITDTVREFDTPLVDGDRLTFFETPGTLPSGIETNRVYFVFNGTGDGYQLSEVAAGPAITFSAAGSVGNEYQLMGADANRIVTFDNTTNTINDTSTPRVDGDIVSFFKELSGTLPPEIDRNLIYFVINKTVNAFQISLTDGGAAVTFTDDGVAPVSYNNISEFVQDNIVEFDNTANEVLEPNTERVDGDVISFFRNTGTLPAALFNNIFYYVVQQNTDDFQLSLTEGGSAIALADDGSGVVTYEVAEALGVASTVDATQNVPRDAVPHALTRANVGDTFLQLVINNENAVSILVSATSNIITE